MSKRILNKPAIYAKIPKDGINIATYNEYPYYETESSKLQTRGNAPIYRYAKNYKFNRSQYCICMITKDSNSKAVEAYFDKLSKKLTPEMKQSIKDSKSGFPLGFTFFNERYEV